MAMFFSLLHKDCQTVEVTSVQSLSASSSFSFSNILQVETAHCMIKSEAPFFDIKSVLSFLF